MKKAVLFALIALLGGLALGTLFRLAEEIPQFPRWTLLR